MRRLVRIIATVGGLGYLPIAPGTAGSLVGLFLGLIGASHGSGAISLFLLAVGFAVGVAVSTQAERDLGTHDPSAIVVDELWGMWAITVFLPPTQTPLLALIEFVLFRAFDIAKPPPLKWLSRFSGGRGIMLDDLGAAAYTLGVLWVVMRTTGLK